MISYHSGIGRVLDLDDPCYNMFHSEPSLECDTHVESEFYVSRIRLERMILCCHCDSPMPDFSIELNSHLKEPEGPYAIGVDKSLSLSKSHPACSREVRIWVSVSPFIRQH
jgi:hypothetical protein